MSKNILIVGGVAGGMSFATRYRRLNQKDRITVIEKGQHVSFANCGLPYFISDEISDRNNLLVAKKTMLEERFDIKILNNHEALDINASEKKLLVKNHEGMIELDYDELILSPGASPITIPIKGSDSQPNIYTLRSIPDADQIKKMVNDPSIKSSLVIGGGFIGLEMAETLKTAGLSVSIVELHEHLLPLFDKEMASYVHSELKENDIDIYSSSSVKELDTNMAILEDGRRIAADIIIMAVGVRPETSFTVKSGMKLNDRGGILVDDNYQTSLNNVYAIGDAIVTKHQITKDSAMIALAGPANRQGRHLADILNGIPHNNSGSLATAIVRVFNKTFASTGLNEKSLEQDKISIMHLHANNHAGYFPNAKPIDLKVIFDKESHKILGAQAVGYEGVDKRIDILATAITAGMSIIDLQDLDLAYAPPFGSAKDIINMAGYYAQNLDLKISESIQWYQLKELMDDNTILIDVRSKEERANGKIAQSINIPIDELRVNLESIDKSKNIIVHCQSGIRSYNAERILKEAGYQVKNLDGGYQLYGQLIKEGMIENV